MYKVVRNEAYDFYNENYATVYPQIHKYPATMLPQIGIEILKEFGVKSSAKLLDPYCGSGSSFASGLEVGITNMAGYDLNPLAILISSVKFTRVSIDELFKTKIELKKHIYDFLANETKEIEIPQITNMDFWFKPNVIKYLGIIKHFVDRINNEKIRNFYLLVLSELIRECSNTRNNEFKLFRMKPEDILAFNPDVLGLFWDKCEKTIEIYQKNYLNKIDNLDIKFSQNAFDGQGEYDVVLTSPPYGDSRTTVAYGQFSTLSNEWLGVSKAREIDKILMGGSKNKEIIKNSLISDHINTIYNLDEKRAYDVNAFYCDLNKSITDVAKAVRKKGISVYVVGNRMVKGMRLPTDQFIAESFTNNGFKHLITYERLLSNKTMPKSNSPTNKSGITKETMNYEYIVCCIKQ